MFNVPKEDHKILSKNEANFIEILVVFGPGISNKKEEHFQSYLSNLLWHYDWNDSAKYHFQIQLISN